ncbi:MAG: hypothetical protein GWN11_10545 [Candidatus Dadabacteria bacterium]|nr:hypothetical protein [Candidatus Dadabacteria bacterium]
MRFKSVLSLLIILIVCSSCYSRGKFGQSADLLQEATESYYQLIKWKYYDRAKVFIDLEDRAVYEDFVLRLEEDLNFTNYEIKGFVYSKDKKECEVKVAITYYTYPSVSEKKDVLYEKWVERGNTWFVKPDFSHEFYQSPEK